MKALEREYLRRRGEPTGSLDRRVDDWLGKVANINRSYGYGGGGDERLAALDLRKNLFKRKSPFHQNLNNYDFSQ